MIEPVSARQHVARRGLAGEEGAFEIGVDDRVPVALGQILGREGTGDTGRVHENVDCAELRDRGRDGVGQLAGVANVRRKSDHSA